MFEELCDSLTCGVQACLRNFEPPPSDSSIGLCISNFLHVGHDRALSKSVLNTFQIVEAHLVTSINYICCGA